DLFVAQDGNIFVPFLTDTTLTSFNFVGVAGHIYAFYTVARDNVGHVEPAPAVPDAITFIPNSLPLLDPIGNRSLDEGETLTFTAHATDPDTEQSLSFSLDRSAPAGASI